MGFFDDIKKRASNLTQKAEEPLEGSSETQQPPLETEPEVVQLTEADGTAGEGPSRAVRGVMSTTASWLLRASKKTMDLLVSRYEPQMSVDSILEPEDINLLLEASAEQKKVNAVALIWLASNSLETLETAKEKCDELLEQGELDSEGERVELVLAALEAIKSGQVDAAKSAIGQIEDSDSEFNHPVISRFMVEQLQVGGGVGPDLAEWCEKALFYHPLDRAILTAAEQALPEGGSIFRQMLGISR